MKNPKGTNLSEYEIRAEKFKKELCSLINSQSIENGSDTPDFILAEYLFNCLLAFENSTNARNRWYGK